MKRSPPANPDSPSGFSYRSEKTSFRVRLTFINNHELEQSIFLSIVSCGLLHMSRYGWQFIVYMYKSWFQGLLTNNISHNSLTFCMKKTTELNRKCESNWGSYMEICLWWQAGDVQVFIKQKIYTLIADCRNFAKMATVWRRDMWELAIRLNSYLQQTGGSISPE